MMLMDGEGSFAVAASACPAQGRSQVLLLPPAPGRQGSMGCSCASLLGPPKVEKWVCWRGRNQALKNIPVLASPLLAGVDVLCLQDSPALTQLFLVGLQQPSCTRCLQSQSSTARAELRHQLPLGRLVYSFSLCSLVDSSFYGIWAARRKWFWAGPVGTQPMLTETLLCGLPQAGGSSLWGCSLRDCLVRQILGGSGQPWHDGAQLLPKPSWNFTYWCWD